MSTEPLQILTHTQLSEKIDREGKWCLQWHRAKRSKLFIFFFICKCCEFFKRTTKGDTILSTGTGTYVKINSYLYGILSNWVSCYHGLRKTLEKEHPKMRALMWKHPRSGAHENRELNLQPKHSRAKYCFVVYPIEFHSFKITLFRYTRLYNR